MEQETTGVPICTKHRLSKKQAQTALNLAHKEGRMDNGRIYPCEFCGFYHLTHKPRTGGPVYTPHLSHFDKWKQLLKT